MKKSFIILVGFLVTIISPANLAIAQRTCGTDAYQSMQIQKNPKLEINRQLIENQVQSWVKHHANTNNSKKSVITIPVVVHVVYNSSNQNISDAQVQSQLLVLNEDYRRTNADASNTPTSFQGVAADCEIEFCLAQQDPNGAATNGITRTSTSSSSFSMNDNVKSTSSGGEDAWPRNDYLNIWVCNLSGGLLGYATPPGGSASTDGVVIGYNYFGTTGAASPPFNKGRTTTHEIGHWLNLYHTFEGGCSGTSQSNCATSGDRACDTPPTSSSNYGCPSNSQNTCTETPTDQNDMHMNFMDYTDDACMNTFTLDQKSRMLATLNGTRSSILSSQGCGSMTSNALDASISGIISPGGTGCTTIIIPIITLNNLGSNTLTSVTINYDIDGSTNTMYSWTGSLAPFDKIDVTLPSITTSTGSHTFNCSTSNPNGGSDQDPSNDANLQSFTITGAGLGVPLPYTEGFEASNFPPSGWSLDNPEANASWTRDTSSSGFGNSNACAQMYFFSPTEDITGQSDHLYTLELDFSTATSPTVMEWNLAYAPWGSSNYDSLIIWVSIDCGATWTRAWQNGGSQMATAPETGNNDFTPSDSEWTAESLSLNAYIGNPIVQIQFQAYSLWGNNLYLDDINIYSAPDSTLTIKSNQLYKNTITLYPNPSKGLINISSDIKTSHALDITVFNSAGEVIIKKDWNFTANESRALDISDFARGIYLVRIIGNNSMVVSKKIALIK